MKINIKYGIYFIASLLLLFAVGYNLGYEFRIFRLQFFLIGLRHDQWLTFLFLSATTIIGILLYRICKNNSGISFKPETFFSKHRNKLLIFSILLISGTSSSVGFENNNKKIFKPELFGAKADGTTDDHTPIQNAVLAADADGGGDVVFESKVYNTGTGLITSGPGGFDYNCQIRVPYDTAISSPNPNLKTIRFIGQQGENNAIVTGPLIYQLPSTKGTVLLSGYVGTHSTSKPLTAIIGTTAPPGAFATINLNSFEVYNINFVYKSNPNGSGPEIGAINAHDAAGFNGDHIGGFPDSPGTKYVQPNRNIAGITLPGNARGAMYSLTNSSFYGTYWGVIASEHSYLNNVAAFECYNGFGVGWMTHAAYWGRISSNWCHNGIYANYDDGSFPQTGYLSIAEFDQEVGSGNAGGIAWLNQNFSIMDTANRLRSTINYTSVIQNSAGVVNSQFTMSGGVFIDTIAIGSPKFTTSSGFLNTQYGLQVNSNGGGSQEAVKAIASSSGRLGYFVQNTNTQGVSDLVLSNERAALASYSFIGHGGSATNTAGVFGYTNSRDMLMIFSDGASTLGAAFGTTANQPTRFGTNNLTRVGIMGNGNVLIGGGFSQSDVIGNVQIQKAATGAGTPLMMRNPTAGTGNYTDVIIGNDLTPSSSVGYHIDHLSSTFTSLPNAVQHWNFDNGIMYFATNNTQFMAGLTSGNTTVGSSNTDNNAVFQIGNANTSSNASFFIKGSAVDVSSGLADGMGWYNSTTHILNFRDNSTTYGLAKTLTGTGTLDFPSTGSTAVADLTITVTGAAVGDIVSIGVPNASMTTTASFFGWVSSSNTVTVRFSPKATEDPASGTFKATIIK